MPIHSFEEANKSSGKSFDHTESGGSLMTQISNLTLIALFAFFVDSAGLLSIIG
jgi:hypothetical protein